MTCTSENEFAHLVMKIALGNQNKIATFAECFSKIPSMITLTPEDTAPSVPRNGEPLWYQRIRNIKSHSPSFENFINKGLLEHIPDVGYKITSSGETYISKF